MKKSALTIEEIKGIREILCSPNFQETAIAVLQGFNENEMDISRVFDYDTVMKISDTDNAAEFLTNGDYFQDLDFTKIRTEIEDLENFDLSSSGADTGWAISAVDDAEKLHEENRQYCEKLENALEALLPLVFDNEDGISEAISFNLNASRIKSQCYKIITK